MDGSGVQLLMEQNDQDRLPITGLSVDYTTLLVYWTRSKPDGIEISYCDLNGNNRQILPQHLYVDTEATEYDTTVR